MKARAFASFLIVAAIVIGGGVWGVGWWQERRHFEITDNAYVRGSITMIASRLSGYVLEVPPPTHSHVVPGDVLAVFDPEPFQAVVDAATARVAVAEARVGAARAEVQVAGSMIEAAEEAVASARASRTHAEARKGLKRMQVESAAAKAASIKAEREHSSSEFERAETLLASDSISVRSFDAARTRSIRAEHNSRAAVAEANMARSDLTAIDAELIGIDARVRERSANLAQARATLMVREADLEAAKADLIATKADLGAAVIDLESTKVLAPIEGFIANQTVEPGFYIEEGWPMMAVVPLQSIWITANFKETQIENLRTGQDVKIEIDAFPEHLLDGRILSFAPASAASFSLLPPQNASGNFVKVVQRLPVKILFDIPSDLKDRIVPGMSAVVSVDIRTAPEGASLSERMQ